MSDREIVQLLERLVKSMERLETTLCGSRQKPRKYTAEELARWERVIKGGFVTRAAGPSEDGIPPSGGIPPWERDARDRDDR